MSIARKDTRKLVETRPEKPRQRLRSAHRYILFGIAPLCRITAAVSLLGNGHDQWVHRGPDYSVTGVYWPALGWYLPETGERLPATATEGMLLRQAVSAIPVILSESEES